MKLAIIGTDGLPARYGGFETFAMEVSPRIVELGHEVLVVGSSIGRPDGEVTPPGVRVRNLPMRANGVASIPFDLASFAAVRGWADAVLLLGVSAGPLVPLMKAMTANGNIIVNVDGLESRRAKWSDMAKKYLALSESIAIRHARHVIADNLSIAEMVRDFYGRNAHVIAYGNDHVRHISDDTATTIIHEKFGLSSEGYYLTVARIEPENHIAEMMDAIPSDTAYPYVIVGNFDGSPYGQSLIDRHRDKPWIRPVNAIYDPDILAALRAGCRAYLHGHSVGGTNPSLVEILPYGRPIIAFDCSFNRHTLSNSGGYFSATADLHQLLVRDELEPYRPPAALRTDPRYNWKTIAEHYAALAFGKSANA